MAVLAQTVYIPHKYNKSYVQFSVVLVNHN